MSHAGPNIDGRRVILVNGVPGSGKSTAAAELASALHLQVLSLDRIKECLFDVIGVGDREYNRLLGQASMKIIWRIVNDAPPDASFIIDAWLPCSQSDDVRAALSACDISLVLEIWCYGEPTEVARRYEERVPLRHHGHLGAFYAKELLTLAATATPLALGPVFRFRSGTDAVTEMIDWAADHLMTQGS